MTMLTREENISLTLHELFKDQNFTDITIVCHEKVIIPAHRFILTTASTLMKQLLEQDVLCNTVYLTDISNTEMRPLLEYIYLGQVSVRKRDLESFRQIATVFGIQLTDFLGEEKFMHQELGSKKYSCDQCEFESNYKQSLRQHVVTRHDLIKIPCTLCDYWGSKTAFYQHMKKNHGRKYSSKNEQHHLIGELENCELHQNRISEPLIANADVIQKGCAFDLDSNEQEQDKESYSGVIPLLFPVERIEESVNCKSSNSDSTELITDTEILQEDISIVTTNTDGIQEDTVIEHDSNEQEKKTYTETPKLFPVNIKEEMFTVIEHDSNEQEKKTYTKTPKLFPVDIKEEFFTVIEHDSNEQEKKTYTETPKLFPVDIKEEIVEETLNFLNSSSRSDTTEFIDQLFPILGTEEGGSKIMMKNGGDKSLGKWMKKKLKCEFCDLKFSSRKKKNMHNETVHNKFKYSCPVCDYSGSKKVINCHIRQEHEESRYKYSCTQCNRKFTKIYHRNNHVMAIHEGKRFPCDQCDFKAKEPGNLRSHKLMRHDANKYTCPECDYMGNKAKLRLHMRHNHKLV